jgi:hypothetical protein
MLDNWETDAAKNFAKLKAHFGPQFLETQVHGVPASEEPTYLSLEGLVLQQLTFDLAGSLEGLYFVDAKGKSVTISSQSHRRELESTAVSAPRPLIYHFGRFR